MYIYSTVYLYLQLDIKSRFCYIQLIFFRYWMIYSDMKPVKSTTRAKQHYHCHYFTKPGNICNLPFPTLHQCYPFLLQKQLTDSKPAAFSRSRDSTLQIIKKKSHVITYWGWQARRDLPHFFCVNFWKRRKKTKQCMRV